MIDILIWNLLNTSSEINKKQALASLINFGKRVQ